MPKVCPSCGETDVLGNKFCSKCGTKFVRMLTCNWCGENMWNYKFCKGCGRSRHDALETSPPPLQIRLRNWFSELFSKKETVTETDK